MKKRSIVIWGHKTSISLEAPFWSALKDLAALRGVTLSDLLATIDGERRVSGERKNNNLSSAVRLFILAYYQERIRKMTKPLGVGGGAGDTDDE